MYNTLRMISCYMSFLGDLFLFDRSWHKSLPGVLSISAMTGTNAMAGLQARQPTEAELKATSVVSLELSAKVRTGPPIDDKQDVELPIWAGVLPIDQVKGVGLPQPDPELIGGLEVPQYIAQYHRLSGSAA